VTYDLVELCRLAGVTSRTVRYYISQGLLPSPASSGPGAHYDDTHLDRLKLIRQLQRDHLPLAEIRLRLEEMDDATVRRALEPPSSASDYIRSVLGSSPQLPPSADRSPRPGERSTWERIRVHPDVEIHVRRPLSRDENRRVERLIEQARDIFEKP
jgi:DNA-binding transcriptional MerR regulator